MDIKDLDKKQLILLTLLITFVVSIATGIVTVSLMNQMPKSIPQTINNVIQRTIEKVTTVETPTKDDQIVKTQTENTLLSDSDAIVSIYPLVEKTQSTTDTTTVVDPNNSSASPASNGSLVSEKELGQGVIISDVGLILVDTSILNESQIYKVVLNKVDFDAIVLKKFSNGFTVLKISEKKKTEIKTPEAVKSI